MADVLIQVALETLIPEIRRVFGSNRVVEDELEKLSATLSVIRDVLEDTEQKQFNDKAVRNWLKKVQDLAYDADHVLDEWATQALRHEGGSQSRIARVSKSLSPFRFKFHHNMAHKIKKIREKLDAILKQSFDFHLMARVANNGIEVGESSRPPTNSLVTESEIWGREEDKEKMVGLLLNGISNEKDVFVIPIVGMGGLGKTILAQMVYNDPRVVAHFDLRMWVCASENFELKRLLYAIIESAFGEKSDLNEIDPLQQCLRRKLREEKFLLVLDDIWNEDPEKWWQLKRILNCNKDSAIVVTTRMENVASMMGSRSQYYKLEGLSHDDCWSLFRHRAFGGGSREESPNLIAIGKQIVKKCGGLPLAVNALGSLLLSKSDEKEWLYIRDNEMWKLSQDEARILPALSHLPFHLRRCFAYCSIFPKDHEIEKGRLICLWIAHDFILPKQGMELEDVGDQIFNDLVWRSLLQVVKRDDFGNIISCKMHALVHDLARYVIGNEFFILENGEAGGVPKETRYLVCDGAAFPKSSNGAQNVRTLLLQHSWLLRVVMDQQISDLRCLRSLDLSKSRVKELPYSIGNLVHLRYLNLSESYLTTLPESVSNLRNLQTLMLTNCYSFKKMPRDTNKMSRLRHLDISGSHSLRKMPNRIGQLASLQTLPTFIVGNERGCGIDQLGGLNLRGVLRIDHLERVSNGLDAQEAKLVNKQNLRILDLSWTGEFDGQEAIKQEETLNNLQPCKNLEKLIIYSYGGNQFPRWLQPSLLPNIVEVDLRKCYNCKHLPPLGQLPFLKLLYIESMIALKYIGTDFYGEDTSTSFPSLQVFKIVRLLNLEEWSFVDDIREVFASLIKLTIKDLMNLTSFPEGLLRNCTLLKTLKLQGCNKLRTLGRELENLVALESITISSCMEIESLSEEAIGGLTSLKELKIKSCPKLIMLSQMLERLTSLKTLFISGCNKLMSLPEGIRNLIHLERLDIWDCENLTSLPQEGIGGLTSLKKLEIGCCPKLSTLPATLQQLTELETLKISGLDSLVSLPEEGIGRLISLRKLKILHCKSLTSLPEEGIHGLTTLKELVIWSCPKFSILPAALQQLTTIQILKIVYCHPELSRRLQRSTGEDWFKIAHVPHIYIT